MRVIGTAGHVDHGKSTLVKSLTGIDPDRLAEERKREMTIDLGFAWMDLPDSETVGIVDVPGHIDFIENMLAGIGSIDLVLFVVAADEGIKPQTLEHLAIIDLLGIKNGIIVLTKIDKIDDPDWSKLITEEIHKAVANTVLSNAPIIPVSAIAGIGLETLKIEINRMLKQIPRRSDFGRARLPIDRVFSMTGFGTVVTGTLLDGSIKLGEDLIILPEGIHARVRGLQNHTRKVEMIEPGSRAAVNLSNVDIHKLRRGNILAVQSIYKASKYVDIYFRLLKDVTRAVKHNETVKVFLDTQEAIGRVRLLGSDEIRPGESGWIQLEMSHPIICYKGDKVILRRPSPGETLGGGQIINPVSKSRYRRFDPTNLQQLEAVLLGDPKEIINQICNNQMFIHRSDLQTHSGLDNFQFEENLNKLLDDHVLVKLSTSALEEDIVISTRENYQKFTQNLLDLTSSYHAENPNRKGISRHELSKIFREKKVFINAILEDLAKNDVIRVDVNYVWLPTHKLTLNDKMERQMGTFRRIITQTPFSPPSKATLEEQLGKSFVTTLIDMGELIPLTDDILFYSEEFVDLKSRTKQFITSNGSISVAQLRDLAGTSRKYAVAFLEYLDKTGITKREGDLRRLLDK